MSIQDTIEKLVDAKIAKASQGGAQSVLAEYKGTDSQGKGWVVIAGSTESTPVTRATVEASEGDTVSVTVGDGKCVMDANISNPSAGVAGVKKASQTAQQALEDANTAVTYSAIASDAAAAAKVSAEDAQQTADAVHGMAEQALNDATAASTAAATAQAAAEDAQDSLMSVVSGATTVEKAVSVMQTALEAVVDYDPTTDTTQEWFWHDSAGAHVLGDTTGYRNDITSSGMNIVDASTEVSVAKFGSSGSRIGKYGESHLDMDSRNINLVDEFGYSYFKMSDLRNSAGWAFLNEVFYGNGTQTQFSVSFSIYSASSISVVVDGVSVSFTPPASSYSRTVTLDTAPSSGARIVISYRTTSEFAKAFTIGMRNTDASIGGYSYAEGFDVDASGSYSHAEGSKTHAEGIGSHAEGGQTRAYGTDSHAEGYWTEAKGARSHSEGDNSVASGDNSHAQNGYTIAASNYQTALGRYNVEDANGTYAVILGNGTFNGRSNALTVDWAGNVGIAGDVRDLSGNAKYLPLSGGTMTGNLTIASTTPYLILKDTDLESNVTTSGETDYILFRDKNDVNVGRINPWINNGVQYMRYLTQRNISGNKYNILDLGLDASGNAIVRVEGTGAAAAWRGAIEAATTTGANTYGQGYQTIKFTSADNTLNSNGISADAIVGFEMTDKNGLYIAYLDGRVNTSGESIVTIGARKNHSASSRTNNTLTLSVDNNGNRTVSVSEGAPWRNALGATNGVWNSGTLKNVDWTYAAGSASASFYIRWCKVAHIVYVEVYGTKSMTSNTTATLSTTAITTGNRPSKEADGFLYSSQNNVGVLWVDTSGNVKGLVRGAAASAIYGALSYPVI